MIEAACTCGQPFTAPESVAGQTHPCPGCQTPIHLVCAEALPDGAGSGDFDTRLVVERGPHNDRAGHVYLIAGCAAITLGKLSTSHILLPGGLVSRTHARLKRLDFGPSRWTLEDNQSTNGLWVNGERVTCHELAHGDVVTIGDYDLRYELVPQTSPVVDEPAAAAESAGEVGRSSYGAPAGGGPACPSCSKALAPGAKICTDCGIYVATGRPLLTAKGIDENDLHVQAQNVLTFLSWVVPTGLYPIASEGFGTRKPYLIWTLFIVTILTSIAGFIGEGTHEDEAGLPPVANMMLWAGDPKVKPEIPEIEELSASDRRRFEEQIRQLIDERPIGEFKPHQLVTHAFLHGGIMHLAGNMLFLIVLGVSVNALLGNIKTAILYPVLAVAGGVGHMLASVHEPAHPMVGASGAIMGLAGMYLVLFPVHRMYMAFWIRWGIFAGFKLSWKVWPVRGFWVVLFFISFDVLYTTFGIRDNTAHWAHLGGFMAGVVIALLLLVTRLVNARGGDLLSVTLGRHAWALIGKPSRWLAAPPPPPVRATVLN